MSEKTAMEALWDLTPPEQVAELRHRMRQLLAALDECPEADEARRDPGHPLWVAALAAELALEMIPGEHQ